MGTPMARPMAVSTRAPRRIILRSTTCSVPLQCHANADLGGAAHDAVGCYAVEPDGGKQKGECPEERGQPRDHAFLGEAVGDLVRRRSGT